MSKNSEKQLIQSFANVKLLLSDVDGILTDASVWMGRGNEFKQFHVMDGLGIRILREHGIKVGWISGRPSPATEERAKELEIDFLYQSRNGKIKAAIEILEKTGFQWQDVCYMGDDIVDLGLMKRAGVAVTVPNAIPEVKKIAHYITKAPGGHGAVREVVELILKAQNYWNKIIEKYLE
jgi:3-deoxy-D-manno-octulosonate 8-phosphate phosphatase (KDO 8-P phosphatase)